MASSTFASMVKTGRARRAWVLIGVVVAVGSAVVLVDPARGDESSRYTAARAAYGDAPPCPEGRIIDITTWQEQQAILARFGDELLRVKDAVERWPQIDQYLVVPDDPAPFVGQAEAPEGMTFTVTCVPVGPDTLVFPYTSGGFVPDSSLQGGTP